MANEKSDYSHLINLEKVYTFYLRRQGSLNISDEEAIKLGHLEIINVLGKDLSPHQKDFVIGDTRYKLGLI